MHCVDALAEVFDKWAVNCTVRWTRASVGRTHERARIEFGGKRSSVPSDCVWIVALPAYTGEFTLRSLC